MKRKKAICLLAVMAMLTGMRSLTIQTIKMKKPISSVEVYSYTTEDEYNTVGNIDLKKIEKASYLSLKKLCLNEFELSIHILLQEKAYTENINAKKKYVEEIYVISKEYTNIATLNDCNDKNIDLNIIMIYMSMESTQLLNVVVIMREYILECPYQFSFLSEQMVRIVLFAVNIFELCFYEGYCCVSQLVYIIRKYLSFKNNMKQYKKIRHFTLFAIKEREGCIQQLLIQTDWGCLASNKKRIEKRCIIIYDANKISVVMFYIN